MKTSIINLATCVLVLLLAGCASSRVETESAWVSSAAQPVHRILVMPCGFESIAPGFADSFATSITSSLSQAGIASSVLHTQGPEDTNRLESVLREFHPSNTLILTPSGSRMWPSGRFIFIGFEVSLLTDASFREVWKCKVKLTSKGIAGLTGTIQSSDATLLAEDIISKFKKNGLLPEQKTK